MTAESAGADVTDESGLASLLRGSAEPLSQRYDVALLDLDGVVYVGPDAVPGAPEALAKAAGTGMRLAYVTNNASRTPAADRRTTGRVRGAGHGRATSSRPPRPRPPCWPAGWHPAPPSW